MKNTDENLYDVLGVDRDADGKEIKKAYRDKSKENHPDKGGDAAIFASISFAYSILSDPDARKEYDRYGSTSDEDQKTKAATSHLKSMIKAAVEQSCQHDQMFSGMSGKIRLAQVINKAIKNQIAKTEESISDTKKAIKQLEKRIGVTERKKSEKKSGNIFDGVVSDLIDDANEFLRSAENQLEMLKEALKIASEYRDVDKSEEATLRHVLDM